MKEVLLHDFARQYPAEFAAVLLQHSYEEARELLEALPEEETLAVLAVLPGSWLQRALDGVGDERLALWLRRADIDLAVALLSRVSAERRGGILGALRDGRRRSELETRLHWTPGTLGAIAQRQFLALPAEATVGQLGAELRALGAVNDDAEVLLLDEGGALRGVVDLRRAFGIGDAEAPLRRCLLSARSLPGEMQAAVAMDLSLWRRMRSVPVVDRRRRPVGTVTLAQVRDAMRGTQPVDGNLEVATQLGGDFLDVLAGLLAILLQDGDASGRSRGARR